MTMAQRWVQPPALLAVLGALAALGLSTTVMACQCYSLSPEAALEQADEVFEGSVERFEATGEVPQAYIEHFQLSRADGVPVRRSLARWGAVNTAVDFTCYFHNDK